MRRTRLSAVDHLPQRIRRAGNQRASHLRRFVLEGTATDPGRRTRSGELVYRGESGNGVKGGEVKGGVGRD